MGRPPRWLAILLGLFLCQCAPPVTSEAEGSHHGVSASTLTESTWQGRAPIPTPRVGHTATLLPDGRVLVAGGLDGQDAHAPIEIYDPATDSWTALEDAGIERHGHGAVLVGEQILFGGGVQPTDSIERLDPSTGALQTKVTVTERARATLVPFEGGVLIVGGGDDNDAGFTVVEHLEQFDQDWVVVSQAGGSSEPMPVDGAVATDTARVLYLGGRTPDGIPAQTGFDIGYSADGEPELTIQPQSTFAPPYGLTEAVAAWGIPGQGVAVITGGIRRVDQDDVVDPAAHVFDHLADPTWSNDPGEMSEPRIGHTLTWVPGYGHLIVGGSDTHGGPGHQTTELLTVLVSGPDFPWEDSPELGAGRWGHTTTVLASGRVLVIGGDDDGTRVADTEVLGDLPARLLADGPGTVRAGDCVAVTVALMGDSPDREIASDVDLPISVTVFAPGEPGDPTHTGYVGPDCAMPGTGTVPMGAANGALGLTLYAAGVNEVALATNGYGVDAHSMDIEVLNAAPDHLVVWTDPIEPVAHATFSIGALVKDAYGNIAHRWPVDGTGWSPQIQLEIRHAENDVPVMDPFGVNGLSGLHEVTDGLPAGDYRIVARLEDEELAAPIDLDEPHSFTVGSSAAGPRLVLDEAVAITAGACSPMTARMQEADGTAHAPDTDVDVAIAADPPDRLIAYGAAVCSGPGVSSLTWPAGDDQTDFYVWADQVGTATLTLSAPGYDDGTAEIGIHEPAPRPVATFDAEVVTDHARVGEAITVAFTIANIGEVPVEDARLSVEEGWGDLRVLEVSGAVHVAGSLHLDVVPAGETRTLELVLRVTTAGRVTATMDLYAEVQGEMEILDSATFEVTTEPRHLYGWYGCSAAPRGGKNAAAALLCLLLLALGRRRAGPLTRVAGGTSMGPSTRR